MEEFEIEDVKECSKSVHISCMFLSYTIMMINRTTMDTASIAMNTDGRLGWDYKTAGVILAIGNISYALGKACAGLVVLFIGSRKSYILSLFIVPLCSFFISYTNNILYINIFWCILRFFLAIIYPSMISILITFKQKNILYTSTYISTLSRIGCVFLSIIFGIILTRGASWRWIFSISAVLGFITALLNIAVFYPSAEIIISILGQNAYIRYFDPESPVTSPYVTNVSLANTFIRFISDPLFWWLSISLFFITPISEMITWWPSYLSYSLGLHPGAAATYASIFSTGVHFFKKKKFFFIKKYFFMIFFFYSVNLILGIIISMLLSGIIYHHFSQKSKLFFITGLMLTACLSLFTLRSITPLTPSAISIKDQIIFRDETVPEPFYLINDISRINNNGFNSDLFLDNEEHVYEEFSFSIKTISIMITLFILGCAIGPPIFTPVSTYVSSAGARGGSIAEARGGREGYASTLSGMVDAVGYISTAYFMKETGIYAMSGLWTQILDLMIVFIFFGTLFIGIFMYKNMKDSEKY
eukprot:GHVL01005612.1.p1 GENE.GHVL01005612.1~~GHVL01005612.1.p1  ORF type:complete len:559 (+),score=98.44 GHVL01005612.1:88-1677(+)